MRLTFIWQKPLNNDKGYIVSWRRDRVILKGKICFQYLKKTRQAMYVQFNIEARSCNHGCSGTSISITYSECVFVALRCPACNGHSPYCHLWPTRLYNSFLHFLVNGSIFEKKKKLNVQCAFWFSLQISLQDFSFQEHVSEMWTKIYIGLHVKHK